MKNALNMCQQGGQDERYFFLIYQIDLISSKITKGLSSLAESKIINTKLLKNKILNIDFIFIIFSHNYVNQSDG